MITNKLGSTQLRLGKDVNSWMDGHFHIFLKSLKLTDNARHAPQYDATLSEYLTMQRDFELRGGLLVQPSFFGINNSYLLQTLEEMSRQAPDSRFKAVAVVDPDITLAELQCLNAAGVVGVRLNLVQLAIPDFDTKVWQAFFRVVNDLNWHVELQLEGERLPRALPALLKNCRRVVVDHFGRPNAANPLDCDGFRLITNDITGRLWVKVSAPYRVFPKDSRDEAARKCTEIGRRYEAALGSDALVWGSDWPWTQNEEGVSFNKIIDWRSEWLESFMPQGLATLVPQL